MNDSLIKDIGRSYIVSSLLPASFFSMLAVFIFRRFLPSFSDITTQNQTVVLSVGILILAFSMWLAFLLYSSVDFVFKLYEGYYFPFFLRIPLQYLHYRLQRFHLRKYFEYKELKGRIPKIINNKQKAEAENRLDILDRMSKHELLEFEIAGPISDNWKTFLPTTLGNILAASELYAYEKYSLNGAMLFPRMSMIFPPEFVAALEEKNNQVVFILNSSLLAYLIGVMSILIGSVGMINGSQWPQPAWDILQIIQGYLQPRYTLTTAYGYLVSGSVILVLGYVIYRMSISAVKEYALFIRTSFDLYRFRILRAMNHPVPTSLEQEKLVWDTISQYLITGDRLGEIHFNYQLQKELEPLPAEKKKRFGIF